MNMKNIILKFGCLLTSLLLLLSLAACNKNEDIQPTQEYYTVDFDAQGHGEKPKTQVVDA